MIYSATDIRYTIFNLMCNNNQAFVDLGYDEELLDNWVNEIAKDYEKSPENMNDLPIERYLENVEYFQPTEKVNLDEVYQVKSKKSGNFINVTIFENNHPRNLVIEYPSGKKTRASIYALYQDGEKLYHLNDDLV